MNLCLEDIAIAYNALEGNTVFVWKAPGGSGVASARPSKLARALELCEKMADWNCFITLNPHNADSKPKIDDIRRVEWLMLDFDPKPANTGSDWTFPFEEIEALLARYDVSFLYDVPVIQSGRGIQMWVPVRQGSLLVREAHAAFKVIGKDVAHVFADNQYWQFDTTCCDVSRLVRCPGTINHKTGRLASIAMPPGPIRSAIDLTNIALPEPAVAPKPLEKMNWMYLGPRLHPMNLMFLMNGTIKHRESRHGRLFNCAKELVGAGLDHISARKLLKAGAERCTPNLMTDDPHCVEKVVNQLWTTDYADCT